MGKIRFNEIDNEIYEKYKLTHDRNLIVKFYNRFASDICNIIYYRISSKWYSIPLEKDDLLHLIWKTVESCFKEQKAKETNELIVFILKSAYQNTLKEVKKFLTNGERIMNEASSFEGDLERNRNFEYRSDNIVYIKREAIDVFKDISEAILRNIVKLNKEDVKKVIYLKSLGYKNIEIERKLKFKRSYVRKILLTIQKIGEKF